MVRSGRTAKDVLHVHAERIAAERLLPGNGLAGAREGRRRASAVRVANCLQRRDVGLSGARTPPWNCLVSPVAAKVHAGTARRRTARLHVRQRLSDDDLPDGAAQRGLRRQGLRRSQRRHHRRRIDRVPAAHCAHRDRRQAGAVLLDEFQDIHLHRFVVEVPP